MEKGRLSRSRDFAREWAGDRAEGRDNPQLDREAVFFVNHAVGKELIAHFHQGCNDEYLQQVLDDLK